MTPEQRIDAALDSVLKASGSALRHYTMPKTLADMREAMRKAMFDEYIRGLNESILCLSCGHSIDAHDRQYGCAEDGCVCETPNAKVSGGGAFPPSA